MLETFLKDRARAAAIGHLQPIQTTNRSATSIESELRRYRQNPKFYGRVQLIVGAVGSGKSIFIRRFYKHMMPPDIAEHTYWAFINFNVIPPGVDLHTLIADRFIRSFQETNNINLEDNEMVERLFGPELRQFERGPAKQLLPENKNQWHHERYLFSKGLVANKEKVIEATARHFAGEKKMGIVIVFDNVDKRSRDLQLELFEAAQWIKDITRALVIVNLRDSTFEAHKDEKPLDAFINAVNFYIRPPRFAEVIKKRKLVEPESLLTEQLQWEDPVQVRASGFIHMRYLLQRPEYIVGVSADTSFSSFDTARTIAGTWTQAGGGDPGFRGRQRIIEQMEGYMRAEYDRRCKRYPFYADLGHGGKITMQSMQIALNRVTGAPQRRGAPVRSRPPRR